MINVATPAPPAINTQMGKVFEGGPGGPGGLKPGGTGAGGLGLLPGETFRQAMLWKQISSFSYFPQFSHRLGPQLFIRSVALIPFIYAEMYGLSHCIPKEERDLPLHDRTNFCLPRRPRILFFTTSLPIYLPARGEDSAIVRCSSIFFVSNATNPTVTTLARFNRSRRLHLHRQRLR